jgi:hypothetical protein
VSLYNRIASTPEGERGLAAARLRRWVYHLVYMAGGGMGEAEMRRRSGLSKRAARRLLRGDGDLGNLTVNEFAAWLWAGGYEADIKLVRAGKPRADVLERREAATASRRIELGQKSPEGVVRPPLVTVQQETPPPPVAPIGDDR